MPTPNELIQEIEKCSPAERVRIIDEVLRDMMHPDPEIDRIWAGEAQRRLNAFRRGEVRPVPYETVMARYRQS